MDTLKYLQNDYDRAMHLQSTLIGGATKQFSNILAAEYVYLRKHFLDDPTARDLVPDWVRSNRDLSQFRRFMQEQFNGYSERRKYIYEGMTVLLEHCEFGDQSREDRPPASDIVAIGQNEEKLGAESSGENVTAENDKVEKLKKNALLQLRARVRDILKNSSGDELLAYDVFISYRQLESAELAKDIHDFLARGRHPIMNRAINVFWDNSSIKHGQNIHSSVGNAMNSSSCFVILLTKTYGKTEYTKFEEMSITSTDPGGVQERTLPVLVQHCSIPNRLKDIKYVDFTFLDNHQPDELFNKQDLESVLEKACKLWKIGGNIVIERDKFVEITTVLNQLSLSEENLAFLSHAAAYHGISMKLMTKLATNSRMLIRTLIREAATGTYTRVPWRAAVMLEKLNPVIVAEEIEAYDDVVINSVIFPSAILSHETTLQLEKAMADPDISAGKREKLAEAFRQIKAEFGVGKTS